MLDLEIIIKDYRGGVSITEIAKTNDVSIDTIRYNLEKHDILETRRRPANLNEALVVQLYTSDTPIKKIASICGVSTFPVAEFIRQIGIGKPTWLKSKSYSQAMQLLNYDFFAGVAERCVSQKHIMIELDCGQGLVKSLCAHHNISLPNSSTARSIINQRKTNNTLTFESFIVQYEINRNTLQQVAAHFGITTKYLHVKINGWGFSGLRSNHESRTSIEYQALKHNADKLRSLLIDKQQTLLTIATDANCCVDSIHKLAKLHNIKVPRKYISKGEQDIADFVSSIIPDDDIIITTDRSIIHPYELDIVIPSLNIAIEYCGLYWHSEQRGKTNKYHLDKLNKTTTAGYELITIFEDEWIHTPSIVKSRLTQLLNSSQAIRIHARKCKIIQLSSKVKNTFLNTFHIQGGDRCNFAYGLVYNDVLTAVMTFSVPNKAKGKTNKLNTTDTYELNRFATDPKYIVRGGAGKLLAHFKRNVKCDHIFSYADRRWSSGKLYYTLGFNFTAATPPNYWYIAAGSTRREHRYKYNKHTLVAAGYDSNLTERVIMQSRNYTRIWDCGMLRFDLYY